MRPLAEYIVSVSTAAILCGILNAISLKGAAKEILKLVSGLFLAFCVISPVSNLQLPELTDIGTQWQEEASDAVKTGEELSREALLDSITQQLTAYILDKARQMELDVSVQVFLEGEEDYLPDRVILSGNGSASEKQTLIREIAADLGIPEEDVQWSGQP